MLYGDEIFIRSDRKLFKQTLYRNGSESDPAPATFEEPVIDPDAPTRGCRIEVPYRTRPLVTKHGEPFEFAAPEAETIEEIFRRACTDIPQRFIGVIRPGVRENYEIELRHHRLGSVTFLFRCRNHALAVVEALIRYQRERGVIVAWGTQAHYSVGFDEELLTALQESNCRHLFAGFESMDAAILWDSRTGINSTERCAIQNIHRHQMQVTYSTIIEHEYASARSIERFSQFVEDRRVMHGLPTLLNPSPGRTMREYLEREERILTQEPCYYNLRNGVYCPTGLSPEGLEELHTLLTPRLFGCSNVLKRGETVLGRPDPLVLPWLTRVVTSIASPITAFLLAAQRRLRLTYSVVFTAMREKTFAPPPEGNRAG